MALFFTATPSGVAAGKSFLMRIGHHKIDPEPAISQASMMAQAKALITWDASPNNFQQLEAIKQPTLIVNGSDDLIVPTINSFVLYQHIPDAQLVLYPDSGHGSLFQYHDKFVAEVNAFLGAEK